MSISLSLSHTHTFAEKHISLTPGNLLGRPKRFHHIPYSTPSHSATPKKSLFNIPPKKHPVASYSLRWNNSLDYALLILEMAFGSSKRAPNLNSVSKVEGILTYGIKCESDIFIVCK